MINYSYLPTRFHEEPVKKAAVTRVVARARGPCRKLSKELCAISLRPNVPVVPVLKVPFTLLCDLMG
jgi:hypothetical protein